VLYSVENYAYIWLCCVISFIGGNILLIGWQEFELKKLKTWDGRFKILTLPDYLLDKL